MVPGLPDGCAAVQRRCGSPTRRPIESPIPTRGREPDRSWTEARTIPRAVGGLDYWIICDDQRAYLFLTSLNGKMWRLWTRLEDFPHGFGDCQLALQAKIFEASHTYRLKGQQKYLTIIEENGRRYYKAYLADRLDGPWQPIADTAEQPFAGWKNIRPAPGVAAVDRQRQPRRVDPRRHRPDTDHRPRQSAIRVPRHARQQTKAAKATGSSAHRHAQAGRGTTAPWPRSPGLR